MCVIMCFEDNYPSLQDLKDAELMNSDGAGIAYIENKTVVFKKGLTAQRVHNLIEKESVKLPFIVHFRIKSVGDITPELCHPFKVSREQDDFLTGKTDKVLFHNGTWTEWDDVLKDTCLRGMIKFPDGQLSDSKVMAFLASIYGDNFLQFVSGRVALLTKKGIVKYGDGWKDVKGTMCSNSNHESIPEYKNPLLSYYKYQWRTKKEIALLEREEKITKAIEDKTIKKGQTTQKLNYGLNQNHHTNCKCIICINIKKELTLEELEKIDIPKLTEDQVNKMHGIYHKQLEKYEMQLKDLTGNLKSEKYASPQRIKRIKERVKDAKQEILEITIKLDNLFESSSLLLESSDLSDYEDSYRAMTNNTSEYDQWRDW